MQPFTGDAAHGARPTDIGDLAEGAKSLYPFGTTHLLKKGKCVANTNNGSTGSQSFSGNLRAISSSKLELGSLLLRKGLHFHLSLLESSCRLRIQLGKDSSSSKPKGIAD